MMRALLLFGLCVTLSACGKGGSNAEAARASKSPKESKDSNARVLKVDPQLLASGRIVLGQAEEKVPDEEVMISGQVVAPPRGKAEIGALMTSRIRSVAVQEGDGVRSGAVLATLDAPDAARILVI